MGLVRRGLDKEDVCTDRSMYRQDKFQVTMGGMTTLVHMKNREETRFRCLCGALGEAERRGLATACTVQASSSGRCA